MGLKKCENALWPPNPPRRFWLYLIAGICVGGVVAGGTVIRSKWVRRAAWLLAMLWCTVGGGGSLILLYTWLLTRHIPPRWNQNLWPVNPLLLALLVMIPMLRRPKVARAAVRVALIVVVLGIVGIVIKALPIARQQNADLIALALTANAGMAAALLQHRRVLANQPDRPIMKSP